MVGYLLIGYPIVVIAANQEPFNLENPQTE